MKKNYKLEIRIKKMNWNEIFVYYFMIPLACLFGGIGNITGLIIFFRKSMAKIGPVYAYRMLFLADIYFVPQMINSFLSQAFGTSITNRTNLGCKIYNYFIYSSCKNEIFFKNFK